MKKETYGKSRFWQGRGVYAALAVSLIGLGAVVAAMAVRTLDTEEEASQPPAEMVEQVVTNQPDNRTTTSTTTTTTTTATTTTTTQAADLYILPLSNTVQKPFSPTALLFCETMQDWRTHSGVDFAGEEGQTVKALANGTILSVEKSLLWGGIITIDHGVGVQSRYYGVTATVREGQTVEVGEGIGALSGVPCEVAQSPHLHLEMSIDGEPVDPVTALAKEVRYADSTTEEAAPQ
ncbi:MAG: M23 family metallopeptidase [Clostridia bacterium]|nr:M23 family metallopeptidase [Clostridia bacterium]